MDRNGVGRLAGTQDFDVIAAALRADAQDARTFLQVLAGKLQAALPGAVQVRRAGGLFVREHPVVELAVSLGDWQFHLAAGADGVPTATRAHSVRGIALKSEVLPLDAWVTELVEQLAAHARSGATAAESLHRLLTE